VTVVKETDRRQQFAVMDHPESCSSLSLSLEFPTAPQHLTPLVKQDTLRRADTRRRRVDALCTGIEVLGMINEICCSREYLIADNRVRLGHIARTRRRRHDLR